MTPRSQNSRRSLKGSRIVGETSRETISVKVSTATHVVDQIGRVYPLGGPIVNESLLLTLEGMADQWAGITAVQGTPVFLVMPVGQISWKLEVRACG